MRPTIATAILVSVFAAGCAVEDADSEDDVVDVPAEQQISADVTTSGPQIVYVNFDGPVINDWSVCSNAATNHSSLISYMYGKSSMNFAAFTDASAKTEIVSDLRDLFAAYNIEFTTTRPSAPPYEMLIVTPSNYSHHGIAPLDCG